MIGGTFGTFKPIQHEIAERTCTYFVPASTASNKVRAHTQICSGTCTYHFQTTYTVTQLNTFICCKTFSTLQVITVLCTLLVILSRFTLRLSFWEQLINAPGKLTTKKFVIMVTLFAHVYCTQLELGE